MFVTFRLKPGRDDDLIESLEGYPGGDRSYYIRELLRKGLINPSQQVATPGLVKIEPKKGEPDEIKEADLEKSLDSWA